MPLWTGTVAIHNGRFSREFSVRVKASQAPTAARLAIADAYRQRARILDGRRETLWSVKLTLTRVSTPHPADTTRGTDDTPPSVKSTT